MRRCLFMMFSLKVLAGKELKAGAAYIWGMRKKKEGWNLQREEMHTQTQFTLFSVDSIASRYA